MSSRSHPTSVAITTTTAAGPEKRSHNSIGASARADTGCARTVGSSVRAARVCCKLAAQIWPRGGTGRSVDFRPSSQIRMSETMAHEFILGKQVLLRSYAFVHVPAELL